MPDRRPYLGPLLALAVTGCAAGAPTGQPSPSVAPITAPSLAPGGFAGASRCPGPALVRVAGRGDQWAIRGADGQGEAATFSRGAGMAWHAIEGVLMQLEEVDMTDEVRLRRITAAGMVTSQPVRGLLATRAGDRSPGARRLAVGPDGDLWTTQRGRVVRLGADGVVKRIYGGPAAGASPGPHGATLFFWAAGLAVGPDGKVYLAIRSRPADPATTCADDLGDPAPCPSAGTSPTGVLGPAQGAADTHAVLRLDPATGAVETLAGSQGAGYVDGPGTTAKFGGPSGSLGSFQGLGELAIAPSGDVFVLDPANQCIRRVAVNEPGHQVTTFVGDPKADSRGPAWTAGKGRDTVLRAPVELEIGSMGDLYVRSSIYSASTIYPPDVPLWGIQRVNPAGEVTVVAEGCDDFLQLAAAPTDAIYVLQGGAVAWWSARR